MSDVTSDASVQVPNSSPDRIRQIPFDAPWEWLAAGWQDVWRNPALSLGYGAAFSIIAAILLFGLVQFGWQSLILVFGGGFLIVGPFLAVGLYEVSRRYDAGLDANMSDAVGAGFKAPGQLLFMGAILLFLFFAWIRIAILLFMLFIGTTGFPPASEFMQTLLFTNQGLGLLVVGTLVGGVIASLVFALSVISVPLLMVEKRDSITAMGLSLEAVRKNFKPMALWATLIAAFIALGIATLFVGLVFAFPLVGHATWHAFKDTVVLPEAALQPAGEAVADLGGGI